MPTWTCTKCHHNIPAGEAPCHCSGCHETFIGLNAFDHHRQEISPGIRKCVNPNEVPRRKNGDGFNLDDQNNWHWEQPKTATEYQENRAHRRAEATRRLQGAN